MIPPQRCSAATCKRIHILIGVANCDNPTGFSHEGSQVIELVSLVDHVSQWSIDMNNV